MDINFWGASNLNAINLNQNYLTNIGAEWSDLIAEHTWIVGGNTTSNIYRVTVRNTYQNEIENPISPMSYKAKVGLMYVSDYGYAASPENWQTTLQNYDGEEVINNNWLFMGLWEWSITRSSDSTSLVFGVDASGDVYYYFRVNDGYVVRPVFYLKSDVEYVSGDGTQQNPFRIQ